jgi:hypothetical protein
MGFTFFPDPLIEMQRLEYAGYLEKKAREWQPCKG